jgi:hypothetical protein
MPEALKQPNVVSVPSLRCPEKAGGCGRDYSFRVAIGPGPRRGVQRLYLECTGCGRKTSFVLADTVVDIQNRKGNEVLDQTGPHIKVQL